MGVSSSAVDRHMCDESSVPWLRPAVEGLQRPRPVHKSTATSPSTMDQLPRSKSFTQPWNAIPTEDEEQEEDGEAKEPDDDHHVDPARPAALHRHRVGPSVAHKKRLSSIQTTPKTTMASSSTPASSSLETSIQEKLVGHEVTSKHGTGTIIQYLHQDGNKHHFLLQVRRYRSLTKLG